MTAECELEPAAETDAADRRDMGFAAPSTAAMTSRSGRAIEAGVLNSRMSAPPENMPPAPVITTARTRVGRALSTASNNAARTACEKLLTGGFEKVMTAAAPSRVVIDVGHKEGSGKVDLLDGASLKA